MMDQESGSNAVHIPHNEGKDDNPEAKKAKGGPRKRVSQACDKCRIRKDKCDGKKPTCTTVSA